MRLLTRLQKLGIMKLPCELQAALHGVLSRKTQHCRDPSEVPSDLGIGGRSIAGYKTSTIYEGALQDMGKAEKERERGGIPIQISDSKFAINSTAWRMGADAFNVPRGTCRVLKTCRYYGRAMALTSFWIFRSTVEHVRSSLYALSDFPCHDFHG